MEGSVQVAEAPQAGRVKLQVGRCTIWLIPFRLGGLGAENLDKVWDIEVRIAQAVERKPKIKAVDLYAQLKDSKQTVRKGLHRLNARGALKVWRGKNPDSNSACLYLELSDDWNTVRLMKLVEPYRRPVKAGRPSMCKKVTEALTQEPQSIVQIAERSGVSYATARRTLLLMKALGEARVVGEHPENKAGRNTGLYVVIAGGGI